MFVLIVVSVIAAVMFHRKTVEKGYRSPRFWMYPLIVGNGILLFTIAAKWIAKEIAPTSQSPLFTIYGPVVDILAMVMFFLIIAKAWKQIQQLPPME
jgi:hypothetical protein